uniref:endonuclease domain-containing 1 protein-like n=1 Tax=Pristiophorus japonicus TaxID=55135 RepID=UPI00398E7B93
MGAAGLVLFLLLALPDPGTVQGKVVENFDECSWFFQNKIPPQGFDTQNRVKICQRYKNHYHFVTLYRPDLRIPVYSAYRYPCTIGVEKKFRSNPWFYEPQIDDRKASAEMTSSKDRSSDNQAVDADYKDSGYDRGHLYPFSFNENDSATATCTLTNAVPQKHEANVNWNKQVESIVLKLALICHKSGRSMYVVTGSANSTGSKLKNKVTVPEVAWTALCCTSPPGRINDPCLNNNVWSEEQSATTYDKDFSCAFKKKMEPEEDAVILTVRALQRNLSMIKIFDSCRGTNQDDEAENFEEVKTLIATVTSAENGGGSIRGWSWGFAVLCCLLSKTWSMCV